MSRTILPTVGQTIAIASGKGGVGKTTVTVQLALALSRAGGRVGIFDADVYGPNVPALLGVHRRIASEAYVPVVRRAGAPPYIPPLERYGLKVMSVGLLLAEDQAINPPAATAGQLVVQTLRDVVWGELDILLVDLPPSAGQPQEDLLKQRVLDSVLLVTTPQDMSLLDAGRSLQLFRQSGVRLLGLVENMAYYICPTCGDRHEVFARSPAWQSDLLVDVPVVARIPVNGELATSRQTAAGEASPALAEFDAMAQTLLDTATAR